jgi:hypothetical protein
MSKTENGSLHRLEDGSYLVVGEAASRSFSVYTSARSAGVVAGDRKEIVRIPAALFDIGVEKSGREERDGIYIASRTHHAARWNALKATGAPIVSTWHGMIEADGTDNALANLSALWGGIQVELTRCAGLVLYVEPDDFPLRGAFIETGMAFARRLPIAIVAPGVRLDDHGRPLGSWIKHPSVAMHESVEAAIRALSRSAQGDA